MTQDLHISFKDSDYNFNIALRVAPSLQEGDYIRVREQTFRVMPNKRVMVLTPPVPSFYRVLQAEGAVFEAPTVTQPDLVEKSVLKPAQEEVPEPPVSVEPVVEALPVIEAEKPTEAKVEAPEEVVPVVDNSPTLVMASPEPLEEEDNRPTLPDVEADTIPPPSPSTTWVRATKSTQISVGMTIRGTDPRRQNKSQQVVEVLPDCIKTTVTTIKLDRISKYEVRV